MNQTILSRTAALAALTLVASGLAGCNDRFRSEDKSTLRIVRVTAFDNTNLTNRPLNIENPGNSATFSYVPLVFGSVRVDFSRPVVGTTVQANPGETLCKPSSNIKVTKTSAGSATATDLTALGASSVCYNPAGTNPNIIITLEGDPTCGGPNPNLVANGGPIGLEAGATYVVTATGVKDQTGNSIDFTISVTGAEFAATSTRYQADFSTSSGAVTGLTWDPGDGKDLDGATGVPLGKVEAATGLYTAATAALTPTTYTNRFTLYGTPLTMHFEGGPMCFVGFEALCTAITTPTLTVTTDPTHPISAAYVGENLNGLENHWVPRLPLEAGQSYTFDVPPGIMEINEYLNGSEGTSAGVTSTFTTEDTGANKVVWRWPQDGATGLYPTLEQGMVQSWTGQPMVGVATSKVLAPNSAAFTPTAGLTLTETGGAAPAGVTLRAGDTRNRSLTFTSATDRLPLKNDTQYTMSWGSIPGAEGSGSVTFKTLPFGLDPVTPGFAGEMVRYQTTSVSYRGSVINVGGLAYSSRAGKTIPYLAAIPAKVTANTGAAPVNYAVSGRSEYSFYPLTGGDVTLFEGKPEAGVVVPAAAAGFARLGSTTTHAPVDPWNLTTAFTGAIQYPGSLVGVLPTTVLKPGQSYTLVANVTNANGGGTTKVTLPFSTIPFRVGTALEGNLSFLLGSSPANAGFSSDLPLQLRTTAKVDPAVFGTTNATGGPIRVIGSDGAELPIHLESSTDATRGAGEWILVVPDDTKVKPDTTYTIIVTSDLKSAPSYDGAQASIVPVSYTITTASTPKDPNDPAAGVVCQ